MAASAGVLVIAGATGTLADPTVAPARTPGRVTPPGFTGSHACASCHAAEQRRWSGSDHERAMQPANAQSMLGNFNNATFTQFGVTSRFFRKDGKFFVHTEGPDGKLADFAVTYTFGVTPLQQYLIPLAGGRLQSLSIAWDSRPKGQGGQRWFSLYPDEKLAPSDPLHWTGPAQNWNYMCASCHSTDLRKNFDLQARSYATTWSEINVACEACHGPGGRHVAWAKARADRTPDTGGGENGLVVHFTARSIGQWVIDPKTGNATRRVPLASHTELETCAPCHARRGVIAADYQPGQPLLDAYLPVLLNEGVYYSDGQIQAEDYEYGSFVQSKMYRAGVTCSNCHDPHSLQLRAAGNAVCAQCHLAAKYDRKSHHFHRPGSPGASCAGCHMPVRTYMIVDPRRDHSFRVPRPDQSVTLGVPNACNHCHAERDAQWARATVRAWYGHDASGYQTYAPALHAGRRGALDAVGRLVALVRDTTQPGIARATALGLLRGQVAPRSLRAAQLGLGDADPLVRRAAVGVVEELAPRQRLPLLAPLLNDGIRGVRIEAARALAALPPAALAPELRATLARGIDEYVAAQRVDADRPEAHTNLGGLYAERGEYGLAEAEYRTAIALSPSFTPAYVNLADMYRLRHQDPQGEQVLRQGLAEVPTDAALHHALGLLLVRAKRSDEAIAELRRAAQLSPDDAHYSYVLGIALHSAGKIPEAVAILQAAQRRYPGDRELLWALTTISRDRGDLSQAKKYAKQLATLLPDDPAVQQLRRQLQTMTPKQQP